MSFCWKWCASWNLAVAFPCVSRVAIEEFKQKKTTFLDPCSIRTVWLLFTLRWSTVFMVLEKLSWLAENVTLKVTWCRSLNGHQTGIMKLEMINFSVFHPFLGFSGCEQWVHFPQSPRLTLWLTFCPAWGPKGSTYTWEWLLGVISCLITHWYPLRWL